MYNNMELELIERLKQIKSNREEEAFINQYAYKKEQMQFYEYLRKFIADNGLSMATVMNKSQINKNYGYNIINGTRKNPGRDKVLALCIGAGMQFDDVQKALELAGQPGLSPRDERDIRISVAINNRLCDVLKLNIHLEENELSPLDV